MLERNNFKREGAIFRRKVVSAAVAIGLVAVLGLIITPTASAGGATIPTMGLVGEYLFSQTTGTSVENTADQSGAVANATVVNGTDGQWTGSSLIFGGGAKNSAANWVELPDDILRGKTSATITTEVQIDTSMKSSYNFLWNIGNDSTQSYFFTSVRDAPRTAITTNSNGGEVNARSSASLTADRWYSMTSVIDGDAGTLSFYLDGELVGQSVTSLTPASITDQSLNTIGRAPYPDPFFKGEVSAFRVYDRALDASEVQSISDFDAKVHADTFVQAAQSIVDGLSPITIDDSSMVLPDLNGVVSWASNIDGVTIGSDGVTATARQPAAGQVSLTGTLTATATVRGVKVSKDIAATVTPAASETDEYGYLMVHFIEDSEGYAEKIYLDVSRGDNAEQWDPLNSGEPILASHLGTTGVRDPYLTYNPETKVYYIIATDLRVFGGDQGTTGCTSWCHWSKNGSTKLNIWESTDLVTWSDLRQIDMAVDLGGSTVAELGMAWAPEATWVDDYYAEGQGAFVVYWASNVYDDADANHDGATYSRILWGATPDFTQENYAFGGTYIDQGGNTIDTTMIQNDGKTYRITKDNSFGTGIYMESTEAQRWWEPGATWTAIQTRIGAAWSGGNAGGVEGPAVFKRHNDDRWYLYVDVIPTTGYRPMTTTDLDAGWTQLTSPDFFMAPSTKHGGIISLTKAQYDTIRSADATSAVIDELGSVSIAQGSATQDLVGALPPSAEVDLAYGRGSTPLAIRWDSSTVDLEIPGEYVVKGTVQSIGANLNQWTGAGGSTDFGIQGKQPHSSTAITVTLSVLVTAQGEVPGTTTPGSESSDPKAEQSQELPVTGFAGIAIASLAIVLLTIGLGAVVVARRRRVNT